MRTKRPGGDLLPPGLGATDDAKPPDTVLDYANFSRAKAFDRTGDASR